MKALEDQLLDLGARVEERLGDLCNQARQLFDSLPGFELVVDLSADQCAVLTALATLVGTPCAFSPSPARLWADRQLDQLEGGKQQ
jgi:hypothetical protein